MQTSTQSLLTVENRGKESNRSGQRAKALGKDRQKRLGRSGKVAWKGNRAPTSRVREATGYESADIVCARRENGNHVETSMKFNTF